MTVQAYTEMDLGVIIQTIDHNNKQPLSGTYLSFNKITHLISATATGSWTLDPQSVQDLDHKNNNAPPGRQYFYASWE